MFELWCWKRSAVIIYDNQKEIIRIFEEETLIHDGIF